MNICCYGRKSIYSDHSDSIDNQFRMCRDYVEMKFSGQAFSFFEYQDEAFTGANTNRPDLQRLMADISAGNCDVLIVYQLDRLSRDVRDFANIYAVLEEHQVKYENKTKHAGRRIRLTYMVVEAPAFEVIE